MADPLAHASAHEPDASLRGRIPQLSPAQAAALRDVHRRARWWTTPAGTLQLRPGSAGNGAGAFELDADGVQLGLRLAAAPSPDDADTLRWQDRSGRARLLAWSLAHEQVLVRLSEALGTSLRPLAEAGPQDPDTLWIGFDLHPAGDDAGPVWSGALRAPADWLPALLARALPQERSVELGPWRQWPVAVAIALAGPPLVLADLRSLRPGDVVIVGHPSQPPLHASAAGQRWPLRATPDGPRIEGPAASIPRHQETFPMAEPETGDTYAADTPSTPEDPAARLPVEVEFELGRLDLSLGEIAGLQPGYVFALPLHLEGANVTIRANGRVAGQGELVAVGDTLGVRLVAWS